MKDKEIEIFVAGFDKMKEESKQRVAKMTPEERNQLIEKSRRFARKCEMPTDAKLTLN